MIQSKFIELLRHLSPSERTEFRKWVHSPFVNTRGDVMRLVEFVLMKRSITAVTVDREKAFAYVFPGKKYEEPLLRHAMSYATKNLEDYLAYNNWAKNGIHPDLTLLQWYSHRNLNELALRQLSYAAQQLEKSDLKDGLHYQQNFTLEAERFSLLSKNKRYEDFNLQQVSDALHQYFALEILRQACIAQSFKQVSGKTTDYWLLDSVLQQAGAGRFADQPAIQIYYWLYSLSNQPDDSTFRNLFGHIFKYEYCFKEQELKDIFLLAINYCIKQLNTGKRSYAKDAFDLYLHALDKKYLLENGELSRFTFKNIAFIGIKHVQDYPLTENFIQRYNHYINDAYRDHCISFVKAVLYYSQKQYGKAMKILQQVEFADVLWNIDAKILLLKILFEEKEYDAIPAQIQSLRMFLYRQKNIGYFKTIHQNTLKYFSRLYKIKGSNKAEKAAFLQDVRQQKDLGEKDWFLNRA